VSVTAKSGSKSEKKDDNMICTERSEGVVYRSFSLPAEVDSKTASAKVGLAGYVCPDRPRLASGPSVGACYGLVPASRSVCTTMDASS
jgi:hypothetical protein